MTKTAQSAWSVSVIRRGEWVADFAVAFSRCCVAFCALVAPAAAAVPPEDSTTSAVVGMTARLDDLIIEGSELEAKPIVDQRQPIVLRIKQAIRHGSAYRYQLVYYGLEPGQYNLIDFMQRKDGSSVEGVAAVRVTIVGVLPPGQVTPNELSISHSPWIGGYRWAIGIGGLVWLLGLIVLLRMNRRRRSVTATESDRPLTLAERLRPLVEAAANGTINNDQQADLERLLMAHWRKELQVEDLPPARAMAAMKADPTAGPLLNQLETWLHHPQPDENIDLAALLEPYREQSG